jgi:hypothetical protein
MYINIQTIPHTCQRYDTAGDYTDMRDGTIRGITVSKMENIDFEFLVAIHELIEQHLCLKRGIPESIISKFDIESDLANPGESPDAPYHKEHMFADKIELLIASEMEIDINEYNAALEKLDYEEGQLDMDLD